MHVKPKIRVEHGKSKAADVNESFHVGNEVSESVPNSHVRNRIIIAFFSFCYFFRSSNKRQSKKAKKKQKRINLLPTIPKC